MTEPKDTVIDEKKADCDLALQAISDGIKWVKTHVTKEIVLSDFLKIMGDTIATEKGVSQSQLAGIISFIYTGWFIGKKPDDLAFQQAGDLLSWLTSVTNDIAKKVGVPFQFNVERDP